jgi:hypothetical protein
MTAIENLLKTKVAELVAQGRGRDEIRNQINSLYPIIAKNDPGFASTLEQVLNEHGVTTQEPAQSEQAQVEVQKSTQDPLTEKESIELVKRWVAEDAEVELPERRTFEEMAEDLQEAGKYRTTTVSVSRFKEIVSMYAPDAPHKNDIAPKPNRESLPPYPSELTPLIESGVAYHEEDHWFVRHCRKCGKFAVTCCGEITSESAVRHGEKTLTAYGRQAVGLDPIKPPKSQQQIEKEMAERMKDAPWMREFRGVDELQGNGTVKMYIEEFLPEGTTLFCGLPKEGKSFLALAVAKALTSGRPLFGNPRFSVPEIVPVVYLAAESGDGALKLRCEKFGITKDKTKFLSRTLTQGPMFGLDDLNIEQLVRAMRPVIVLETLIRFNEGTDEDDASENKKLAQAIFRLIALGARAVVGIHHSRKDVKTNPTKEAAVRGSGDALAMVDAVWLVMQDEKLFQGGKGPNEIDVVGWGRDFTPRPMRLALTKRVPKDLPATVVTFAPGIVSCIDAGDLEWVDTRTRKLEFTELVERLVTENPGITLKELIEKTEHSEWAVRKVLKQLGYRRRQGGDTTKTLWTKGKSIGGSQSFSKPLKAPLKATPYPDEL